MSLDVCYSFFNLLLKVVTDLCQPFQSCEISLTFFGLSIPSSSTKVYFYIFIYQYNIYIS